MARIVEVKRRLDGSELRFECELVHRTPSLVIALYQFEDARGPLDSYGCFWARRPYLCYHMVHRANGREAVSRFDVVRDMYLGSDEVRYTDLLLDLWVEGGVAHWEDDDEVAEAAEAERLDADDRARIEAARAVLERRHRDVVGGVRRLLRELGRLA